MKNTAKANLKVVKKPASQAVPAAALLERLAYLDNLEHGDVMALHSEWDIVHAERNAIKTILMGTQADGPAHAFAQLLFSIGYIDPVICLMKHARGNCAGQDGVTIPRETFDENVKTLTAALRALVSLYEFAKASGCLGSPSAMENRHIENLLPYPFAPQPVENGRVAEAD